MLIAYWKLRRLAPRVQRVHGRRQAAEPVIGAYGPTLVPHAQAYRDVYDEAARFELTWIREMAEGRGAVGELVKRCRTWLPLVVRDVHGFDGSDICDKPTVADDVLTDASRLYALAFDARDGQGQPLSYIQALTTQLDAAMQSADKERAEAEAADTKYQELLKNVRETAEVFNTDLKAFRRTLGNLVGRSDKDYQKLRAEKAHVKDEDDDADAPSAPQPVPPADPSAPTPTP